MTMETLPKPWPFSGRIGRRCGRSAVFLWDRRGPTVKDINGKSMHLSGVTLGRPELEDLLRMAGASYDPKTLNEPPARAQKSKEFQVVKQDPWGQDRVM